MSCLNKFIKLVFLIILPLFAISCKQRHSVNRDLIAIKSDSVPAPNAKKALSDSVNTKHLINSLPSGFVDLAMLDTTIQLDIRYVGTHNFTNKKLYPCSRCILKEEVARKLVKVDSLLKFKNLRLLVLDCYRPPDVQEQLWNSKPDPHYVMRPWKGSPHSRGIAVDVTLTDLTGNVQDMGSEYDEFSARSFYLSNEISSGAKNLRWILRSSMKQAGFIGIRTEWWHFQMGRKKDHPIQSIQFPCDGDEKD